MIGVGIGIPFSKASAWSPARLPSANVAAWYRADLGVTLAGLLRSAGTTPPVAMISGLATSPVGIHFRISTGGILGAAKFDWSIDNGATYVATGVTTASSVVLGGTGLTAMFMAGTYNVDNTYDATVPVWADQGTNARDLLQATQAAQPLL